MYNNDDGDENVEIRVMNEENVKLFKEKLSDVNWPNVCSSEDVNITYRQFLIKFQELYAECIPKKSIKKRKTRNTPKTPWMTKFLMKCIRRRNVLYYHYY